MISATPLGHGNKVTSTTHEDSGDVEASAVFDASPERLFRALTTKEICNWWVNRNTHHDAILAASVYPAQQLSFATSFSKVCAASFKPSTVVR